MVNGPDRVFVERGGRIEATAVAFADEEELRNAIERILAPLGRRVDELSPMVDARLADGSRVNVVIPPLAIDGPALSIRRFGARRPGPDRLVELGTLTAGQRAAAGARGARRPQHPGQRRHRLRQDDAAERAVELHRGRGAGGDDRGRRRAAPPAAPRGAAGEPAGRGRGTRRGDDPRPAAQHPADAAGPDRDRRGPRAEAIDMLQAINTGHDGSISTIHANSPPTRSAASRRWR